MEGTNSGLCPNLGFRVSDAEHSDSANKALISLKFINTTKPNSNKYICSILALFLVVLIITFGINEFSSLQA